MTTSSRLPRVCIIGAGSSGIAGAKTLHERGFDFDCFELSDRVGGNWVFNNVNEVSSSYRSLHINTSRERMEYSDYPMPKSYPDFPRHDHIAAYFDDYVDHFGFRDRIQFETGVEHVARRDDGVWDVRLTDRRDRGLRRGASSPTATTGTRAGPSRRSRATTSSRASRSTRTTTASPTRCAGKDVVVLGMGNSAMDIAVDASYHADETYLAARRGAHVLPKYIFGKPIDQLGGSARVPFALRALMFRALIRVYAGPDGGLRPARSPTTSSARRTRRSPAASSTASRTGRSPPSRTSPR